MWLLHLLTELAILVWILGEMANVLHLKAKDAGGSMVIHTFGAYYGLAISWMLYRPNLDQSSRLQGSVYHSDVFAMIGKSSCSQQLFDFCNDFLCFKTRYLNSVSHPQALCSCGCFGPALTQQLLSMETGSTELPSTPTCRWLQPSLLLWLFQVSFKNMESWTWWVTETVPLNYTDMILNLQEKHLNLWIRNNISNLIYCGRKKQNKMYDIAFETQIWQFSKLDDI